MNLKEALITVISRRDLSEAEMESVLELMLGGELSEVQTAAFLAALATKGEAIAEVAGAARSMRRHATRIQPVGQIVVDTCGTGGDRSGSFNISTTVGFVVAGAGVAVAKHGNRAVSSNCGSADVLEALGVKIDAPADVMEQALRELGICFLFAPAYHAATRHVTPVRKQLGVRTIFNMLGPLANPAGATCQLLGVYAPPLTEMFAEVLRRLGTRRALVVHGHDGLDEISVCAPTRVSELKDGQVKTYELSAEEFFGSFARSEELLGGDKAANASILRRILTGDLDGPCRNVVLINAGAALMAAGQARDIAAGIVLAERSIDSGAALDKLEKLIRFTQENG